MADALFIIGARVRERPDAEREIILSKPSGASWRAKLPSMLDKRPATAALVEYVVKLYFRQLPFEAQLTGWETLTAAVRLALTLANGENEEEWEFGQEIRK